MHLEFEYALDGGGNQGFAYVFNMISLRLYNGCCMILLQFHTSLL